MPFDSTPFERPTRYGQLSAQQIFDRAVAGVLQQGAPGQNQRGCVLLDWNGRRCAIGHILDLADLRPSAITLTELTWQLPAPRRRSLQALMRRHVSLLQDLQAAHDRTAPNSTPASFCAGFRTRVREVARVHGLRTAVLDG